VARGGTEEDGSCRGGTEAGRKVEEEMTGRGMTRGGCYLFKKNLQVETWAAITCLSILLGNTSVLCAGDEAVHLAQVTELSGVSGVCVSRDHSQL